MTTLIICITALALLCANLFFELRRDLMMLQQNSYRNERYRRWLSESADSTSGWRLCGLIVFFITLTPFSPHSASAVLCGLFALGHTWTLATRKYKKPLAVTKRVWRLTSVSAVLSLAVISACALIFGRNSAASAVYYSCVAALGCYCGSHLIVMLANTILAPVENAINRRFYNDAAKRLAAMPGLKVIGITGSYGKTTTKHYLSRIMSEHYDTLMTPGSYNTTLGVVRTIREMLKPYHEVFIVEMGAKQPGDIREICDLVHPQAGIITAVGPQHLESFKTIERVQATKFELADALPDDGLAVINNDFEKIADRAVGNCRVLRYAVAKGNGNECADYIAENITYTPAGTTFDIRRTSDGHTLRLTTRLVGECNISNLLGAVAMAQHFGVPDEKIRYAVEKIEQVEHRLNIKRTPGGITIIDDAFNSNPVGSAMALDVLAAMRPGKRILITPGMIELGDRQYELNEKFGRKAASSCDVAIVVGQYNRNAIVEGLENGGLGKDSIHAVDTFNEAQAMLGRIAAAGDTVLYENDLPDTFR